MENRRVLDGALGLAVSVHGALAWGLVHYGQKAATPPLPISGFEVMELPSSTAANELELELELEPEPVPEPDPEPIAAPAPEPIPEALPEPEPKPTAKPAPKPKPKPVAAPFKGDDAVASAPAYAPPIQHAAYLKNPKPAYPTQARKRGMEGRVVLRVVVRADGVVKSVTIESGSGYALLDRAARVAVLRWRFAPATRGGRTVQGEVLIPFDFRLPSG